MTVQNYHDNVDRLCAAIYGLRPDARNRLNTVFMGGMFIGGAVGSAGASLAWHIAGWDAVCSFGAALVAIALGLHVRGRPSERV